MRIVHLNPFYFPYAGGIERRIRAVSRRLARRHEVHVVTAQQPGGPGGTEVEEGGFTVHRLPSRFPLQRFYNPPPVVTPGLGDYLRTLAPDLVDYHFRWSPSYNRAFRHLAAPSVVTYHNTYGEGRGLLGVASRANDRLYMRTLRHANRVVCVSDRVRRDLAAHGIDPGILRVNHNAVEVAEIRAVTGRPQTDLPRPFAMAVGRMVAVKGFDVLVRAWPQVPEPLDLVLVGQGPEKARLAALARRLGVEGRVRFTGWVDEAEKIRLLKAAVAYVHPARFESFPFSILEAMAAGAPLVCAGIGGIPEAVGDAGPLLGHDPAEWAREVALVAADPAVRADMAARSARRMAAFDWDRITAELEGIYAEAVAARA
ncbi:MAG: glycosyltransferase family 4 protein [Halobacteriales archaeon]|nr:glycosyltransferase family 4 protein [Halobacteriales archaeon]